MALILSTSRDLPDLSTAELWQVYNALDCAVTSQALEQLAPLLTKETGGVYKFQMEAQVLALEMMQRGLRVDHAAKAREIARLEKEAVRVHSIIQKYSHAIWKKPLNPNSGDQLKALLYDFMLLPKQYKFAKGERRVTTERQALEKLVLHWHAAPLLNAVMAFADIRMLLQVLNKRLDHDNRMRFSFNVGATETGRWSSSVHPLGSGTNGQNITDEIRRVFIPDEGYVFVNFDLVTAESLGVAYFSGDERYRLACESGDLHTQVSKLVWPSLGWTDNPKGDRAIADQQFYRHFSYRDMSKRGGHLSNYLGKPTTMAMHLRLPKSICEDFQALYFSTYPDIPTWHTEVQAELQLNRKLTTPFGRVRQFFGRVDEHETLKEAVAFLPQSTIADTINKGAVKLWKAKPWVQFLMQIHDAILIQVPVTRIAEVTEFASILEIETPIRGKVMKIPVETSLGWNWGKAHKVENPRGLKKVSNAELLELAKEFR